LFILLTMILNRFTLQTALAKRSFSPSSATRTPAFASFASVSRSDQQDSRPQQQQQQRLVLIGGGHAHVQVIKALNKASRPDNLQVTLIDVQKSASYSGMVPGTISGLYKPEDTLLHLVPLAEWAGIEFIHKKVVDIDIDNNLIYLENETDTPIPFDAVSIDIGSASRGLYETKGAKKYTIPTRPIADLVRKVEEECQELQQNPRPVDVVVIGGGAAGTELSMSIKGRFSPIVGKDNVRVTVLDSGDRLLPAETDVNRNALIQTLEGHGVEVRHGCTVEEVKKESLLLTSGEEIQFTHCLWATGAGAHDLSYRLGNRGLGISKRGWIRVNEYLQSVTHPNIFAAGDCCTMEGLENGSPPKAGVYAVRSGPILIENLTRILGQDKEEALTPYKPQDDFLKLMVCGDGTALGFRFGIPIQGKWVFDLKNEIDSGFMDLFKVANLPELKDGESYDTTQYDDDSKRERPEPLPPMEAAKLLQRTDDDVDFQQAWSILRRMNENEEYCNDVLAHIPTGTPKLIAA
jgi:selenide,water dikinase